MHASFVAGSSGGWQNFAHANAQYLHFSVELQLRLHDFFWTQDLEGLLRKKNSACSSHYAAECDAWSLSRVPDKGRVRTEGGGQSDGVVLQRILSLLVFKRYEVRVTE